MMKLKLALIIPLVVMLFAYMAIVIFDNYCIDGNNERSNNPIIKAPAFPNGEPLFASLDHCPPSAFSSRINIVDSSLPDNIYRVRLRGSANYRTHNLGLTTLNLALSSNQKGGETPYAILFSHLIPHSAINNFIIPTDSIIKIYSSESVQTKRESVEINYLRNRYANMMRDYINSDRFSLVRRENEGKFVSYHGDAGIAYFPWLIYLWNPKYLPDSVPVIRCDSFSTAGHKDPLIQYMTESIK